MAPADLVAPVLPKALRRWRKATDGVTLLTLAGQAPAVPEPYLVAATAACVQGCQPWLTAQEESFLGLVIDWTQAEAWATTEAVLRAHGKLAQEGAFSSLKEKMPHWSAAGARAHCAVSALGLMVGDVVDHPVSGGRTHPVVRGAGAISSSVWAMALASSAWQRDAYTYATPAPAPEGFTRVQLAVYHAPGRVPYSDEGPQEQAVATVSDKLLRRLGRQAAERVRQVIPERLISAGGRVESAGDEGQIRAAGE